MSKINEKWWVVRIGDPRKHLCYAMLRRDGSFAPALFPSRFEAKAAIAIYGDPDGAMKAVQIRITEAR